MEGPRVEGLDVKIGRDDIVEGAVLGRAVGGGVLEYTGALSFLLSLDVDEYDSETSGRGARGRCVRVAGNVIEVM